jgi:hypothetical protein
MIIGGLLIASALFAYYTYTPKQSPKGSLGYYKKEWRSIL